MHGLILAGGIAERLFPITAVVNKHLAHVGIFPMIEYPLFTLKTLGANPISVVTGGGHMSQVPTYLSQTHPKLHIPGYNQLDDVKGIAKAIATTEEHLGDQNLAVILGDNIFEDDFSEAAKTFENSPYGAMVFLKQVEDPERFGVAEIREGNVIGIEEKPDHPKSNLAVTGLYFYDSSVFRKIRRLKPSKRNEYEITDVNNMYIQEGGLGYAMVTGAWKDAGTLSSLRQCSDFVKEGLENRVYESLDPEIKSKIKQ